MAKKQKRSSKGNAAQKILNAPYWQRMAKVTLNKKR